MKAKEVVKIMELLCDILMRYPEDELKDALLKIDAKIKEVQPGPTTTSAEWSIESPEKS